MYDVVQIAGSLWVLAAFAGGLSGRLGYSSYRYLGANAVGSALLVATAIISLEWGFIVLEGAWLGVSVWSIVRKAAGRRPVSAH